MKCSASTGFKQQQFPKADLRIQAIDVSHSPCFSVQQQVALNLFATRSRDSYTLQDPTLSPNLTQNAKGEGIELRQPASAPGKAPTSPSPLCGNLAADGASVGPPLLFGAKAQKEACLNVVIYTDEGDRRIAVLRRPLECASTMIACALEGKWEESRTETIDLHSLQIPDDAWIIILRVLANKRLPDTNEFAPEVAVALFAVIDYLNPNLKSEYGQLLNTLRKKCQDKVCELERGTRGKNTDRDTIEQQNKDAMVTAINLGIQDIIYFRESDENHVITRRAQMLEACIAELKRESTAPNEDIAYDASVQAKVTPKDWSSYCHAKISYTVPCAVLPMRGCGEVLARVCRAWKDDLPHIILDATVPFDFWDNFLGYVHRLDNVPAYVTSPHDAGAVLQAINCLGPDDTNDGGRRLLSIAQECKILEKSREMVQQLRQAVDENISTKNTPIPKAILEYFSKADYMMVAHLDSMLLKELLNSEPWRRGEVSAYELLLAWVTYHGPKPETMERFLHQQKLHDVVDWICAPRMLREEAIALGILGPAAELSPHSFDLINRFTIGPKEKILFFDCGEIFTCAPLSSTVTRWDLQTSRLISSFSMHNQTTSAYSQILGDRLFGSALDRYFDSRSSVYLYNMNDGMRLRTLKEDPPPPARMDARANRYIVSGLENGKADSFRVGVWRKTSFGKEYHFLHNVQPDCCKCDNIVASKNSLFTAGFKDTGNYKIEERNLHDSHLRNSWYFTAEQNTRRVQLFVTTNFVACLSTFSGADQRLSKVRVYSRTQGNDAPTHTFFADRVFKGAVSGHYLAGVARNHFTVWDLRTGDKVHVENKQSLAAGKEWTTIAFDGQTVVVGNEASEAHIYAARYL